MFLLILSFSYPEISHARRTKNKSRVKSHYKKTKKRAKRYRKRKKYYRRKNNYYEKSTVDSTHEVISQGVMSFSHVIDEFFSDTKHDEYKLKNKSKLKLTFDTFVREARGPYIIPELNFRLMLPNTEKKMQLFIESEDEDSKNETSAANIQNTRSRNAVNDTTTGLRYMIKKSGIDFSQDTGVIVNIPMLVFSKFTIQKHIPFDRWSLKIREQVKWLNNTGFTSDLVFDYDRKLSRKFLLRIVNNMFWNDIDYSIRFENGPSLFQQINSKMALSYHAHTISTSNPDLELSAYILQVTYRQNIYKSWLFLQLSPYLNFPRTENFQRVPGATVRFEAIFGYI